MADSNSKGKKKESRRIEITFHSFSDKETRNRAYKKYAKACLEACKNRDAKQDKS